MLINIKIDSFAIVSHLNIDFEQGLTVISGQTGSGKSILFEAIKFGLGERVAKRDHVIFPQAESCQVEMTFDVRHNLAVQQWLDKQQMPSTETLAIKRKISHKKPAAQWVAGKACTLAELQELGKNLVHIHGQNTHLAAANGHFQRYCLDSTGGFLPAVMEMNETFRQWQTYQTEKNQLIQAQLSPVDVELLVYYLQELEQLEPSTKNWLEINQQLNQAQHGAETQKTCQDLRDILGHPNQGITSQLERTLKMLEQLPSGLSGCENAHACLSEALVLCQEASHEVEQLSVVDTLSTEQKNKLEKRLTSYFELARKHQVKPGELEQKHHALQLQYDNHDQAKAQLEKLDKLLQATSETWQQQATRVTALRQKNAQVLAPKIQSGMKSLGMPHASIHILMTPAGSTPKIDGADHIQFLVTTNPDHPLRPLEQAASGGELSRISLIMRQLMTKDDAAVTLAFDEAEAGVSGGVATKVGHLLRALSKTGQVLCITHLPQVAALGEQHFSVEKTVQGGKTTTAFSALDSTGRIQELARMIGHETITETAKSQAKELLKETSIDSN